ncbi:hypothetical protein ACODT3_26825 [Streptomyces sp. 4.24]|uniref:hypothetical protein n=1 Tax=Streptomyces tritrimontium TaxID=3406573 RepID=UPI003BB7D857
MSERIEDLQLTSGEGPGADAFALGSAVLAPGLRAGGERRRRPAFAPEAAADVVARRPRFTPDPDEDRSAADDA